MTQKVRKVLIMVVMAALILCLMAASLTYTFTYGRYAGNDFNADDSPYDDLIEFVGSREYTVRTPEELIQAIEDGYSNIQIAVDAEEPFVITEGVTDVSANLVLDLNGKVVVRNSRNPLLDVQTNVSVVLVYDSSKEGQGAFYNPVGSSLQASGGTLTVGSGNYEDGPRAEEYENKTAAGKLSSLPSDVAIFTRGGITSPDAVDRANQLFYQEIEASSGLVPKTTGRYYQPETSNSAYTLVPADTFLIYTEEENCFIGEDQSSGNVTFESGQLYVDAETENNVISASEFISPECNVASCDFYYYYPINTPGTADTPQDYAVIYGYWDVMALARNDEGMADDLVVDDPEENPSDGLIWPYAAVRMVNGEGFVRGGNFKNNFNAVNTYGIYATDGRLAVSQVPVTNDSIRTNFTTGGDGVCIRVSSSAGSTTGGDEGGGTLDISGGSFSSEIGNTIEMQGGTMNVTAGKFTKNAAVSDSDDNGSAIDITGGTLNSSSAESTSETKPIQFNISGSYVNGIKSSGGEVNIANANFSFEEGEHNQGIYSTTESGEGGTSRARWCDFTIPGDHNYGIHSESGTTRASDCNITMTGDYVVGVYTTGGRALVEDGKINVNFANGKNDYLLTSAAVSTEGGEIYLADKLEITSQSLGVTVRQGSDTAGSLEIATSTITTDGGTTYNGIIPGDVTINTPNATGIYINNGTLTNKGTVTVNSSVGNEDGTDNGWNWVNAEGEANIGFNKYNGVFVQGGSLESTGELNVTFTGVQNDAFGDGDNSGLTAQTAYYLFKTKSYAVRVETGGSADTTVTIASGNIRNSVGGGVLVNGGKVTLGREGEGEYKADENGNSSGLTVETTGYGLENTNRELVNNDSFKSWIYRCTTTGGDAVKIDGGTLKILGGKYQTAHGNGIFVRGAQAAEEDAYAVKISGGDFRGYNSSEYGDKADLTGPAQSYGIKIIGGKVLVNGGTFGSSDVTRTNGSAFFMGLPDEKAEIKIQVGNFYSRNTDAVATFRYTDIIFEDLSVNNQNINVSVTSEIDRAAVALQDDQLFSQGDRSSTVTINGGTYRANGFGVWYGCSQDKLFIQKGIFTGSNISGLYFQVAPNGNNVQLSGGEYYGARNDVHMERNWANIPVCSNNTSYNAIDGNDDMEYRRIVVSYRTANGNTLYDRTINNRTDVADGRCTTTTNDLTWIKDKGEAEVEWYGRWYTEKLVYSQVVIS